MKTCESQCSLNPFLITWFLSCIVLIGQEWQSLPWFVLAANAEHDLQASSQTAQFVDGVAIFEMIASVQFVSPHSLSRLSHTCQLGDDIATLCDDCDFPSLLWRESHSRKGARFSFYRNNIISVTHASKF